MFFANSFFRAATLGVVALFTLSGSTFAGAKAERSADRVWITRPDGSLQCDPKVEGTKNDPVKKAQAQLEKSGVKVLEAKKRNDGAMRAQACGIATGDETSFLIDRAELSQAKALGFDLVP